MSSAAWFETATVVNKELRAGGRKEDPGCLHWTGLCFAIRNYTLVDSRELLLRGVPAPTCANSHKRAKIFFGDAACIETPVGCSSRQVCTAHSTCCLVLVCMSHFRLLAYPQCLIMRFF